MKGKLIVIEGIDGSGKNTQTTAITKHLSEMGKEAEKLHFPLYTETFFGREVGKYLNGEFGGLKSIHPKLAAMLYAGDRFEKREYIVEKLSCGTYIICDRYVLSNLAHHSAKLPQNEQLSFDQWVEELEHRVYKLPKPDLTIFLDMPPHIAKEFVLKKKTRAYTEKKMDLHEENREYLNLVYQKFKKLSQRPNSVHLHCCTSSGVKEVEEISREILSHIYRITE